ncbi:MAG: FAD-binding oxidoreductase [Kineosporiaceae bacterium]
MPGVPGRDTGDTGDTGDTADVDGVPVGTVARPDSTAEVADVLRAAAADGLAVVPCGRGTKLTWGRPPERADVLLDLSAMDRVVEHAAGDLVLVAEAGAPLASVAAVTAGAGQRLAVDETVPGSTVGGTVATATGGPLRLLAGGVRDLLIGVTLVRADGTVARAGGKVVKNVAGYDLGKLVTGSHGTLAVLTEAVFRLHPVPAARRFLRVVVADPAALAGLAAAVRRSPVVASALEVDVAAEGPGSLTVLLEGTADGVAGRAAVAAELLPGAEPANSPPPHWAGLPWDLAARGDSRATALKVTCRLSGLGELLCAARAAPVAVHLRGSAGVGVLHGAIPAGTEPAAAAAAVAGLRATAGRLGGSLVVLDAPAAVKAAGDVWGPVPGLDLMRRVKRQFDPERRLSPGRFVGGI